MRPLNWIVSYPRSGNTFLRILLVNYDRGGAPVPLADLSKLTLGENNERLWTALTGAEPAERSFEAQWGARLDYIRGLRHSDLPGRLLVKSHNVNGSVQGRRGFEFLPQDRIIHVMRHPCDVALSCAAHYNFSLETVVSEMILKPGAAIDSRPDHGHDLIGSWNEHTRSWLNEHAAPVHRVTYFDLVENTAEVLKGIVTFLDGDADEARIEAAVEFSRFQTLRAQEKVAGFPEASPRSAAPFFRVGKPMQWIDALPAPLADRILEGCGPLLDELGFTALVSSRLPAQARRDALQ